MTARQPLLHLIAAVAALLITSVSAHEPLTLHIAHRAAIRDLPAPAATTQSLELRVVNLDQWPEAEIHAALRSTAQILGQCGIRVTRADLLQVTAPESHRHFDTPRSRELARELALPKPAVFFTAGTRQIPAFDAEAIGRGNSRTRPELADTVWIAKGARDLGIVVAHELAHVLMDSGEHDSSSGNLMSESTTPQNTQLTAAQCERLNATGRRNGLLRGVD
ncbi:MAG: hypothetical protein ACO22Q_01380 [Burkholderiales bacterium]